MKRFLILWILAFCGVSGVVAQTYRESVIPWKRGKIVWNDFRGIAPKEDSMIVTTNFYVQSNLQKRKIDGIQYQYIAFDTYMNAAQMWAKESEKTPALLKFCQAAFNLWELNMRKATMEYNTQSSTGMEPVMDYYRSLYSRQYEHYRRITQNGRLEAEVEKMDKEVEAELSRNVFDPVQYVGMLRLAKGGGCLAGMGDAHAILGVSGQSYVWI